ncbi:MAG: TM2 domain-containing protein [Clostridia bacterium]|nr:TM2 domain-containing protein [Clostridia bacterium]
MTTDNIEFVAEKFKESISKQQSEDLKRELEAVSDERLSEIENVKIKHSLITVLLSAFLGLFGAGSFYLGYFKRGLVKICFNVILPLALGLVFLFWLAPMYFDYNVQGNNVSSTLSPINEVLNPCLGKYSDAYKNISTQLDNVEKKNEELKAYLAYVTEDEFEISTTELLNCINEALSNEIVNDLNSLIGLNKLISAEDYNELIQKLDEALAIISKSDNAEAVKNITDLKQRLSVLTDTTAIENAIISINVLNAWSFNSTADNLKTLTDMVDDFSLSIKTDRKSEELTAAILSVSENPLIESCTENMFILEKALEVFAENFESLYKDLQSKYLAFTGKAFVNKDENVQEEEEFTFEKLLNSVKASLNDIENLYLVNELTDTIDGIISKLSADTKGQLKKTIAAIENYQKAASEEIQLPDSENKFVLAKFANQLNQQTHNANEALVAINHEKTEESDNAANGYLQEMSLSINVMIEQKQVFLSVYDSVEDAGKSVNLVKFVENKLGYHNNIKDFLLASNKVKEETNIDSLMDTLGERINLLIGLDNKASSYAYDWKVDSEIIKYLFITLLAIDGTIILAYWIGEVFKDRAKCYNLNYDNIIKQLNK